MKKVVYDFSGIRAPLTGIGRYAIELVRPRLASDYLISAFVNQHKFSGKDIRELITSLESGNSAVSPAARNLIGTLPYVRSLYRRTRRASFRRSANMEIHQGAVCHDINYGFHPGQMAQVTTIYDLSHLHYPETHPRHRVKFLARYFRRLQNSDCRIITISQAIKSELVNDLGISAARISVTHLAADKAFQPYDVSKLTETLSQFKLEPHSYILSVGTMEPRKNLDTTLKAYCALAPELQRKYPLVIAGPRGWKTGSQQRQIERLERDGRIRQLGFVPQTSLPVLYAGAATFVYPSLYEGFGLPLLEAMQCGCPVITSSTGALAEVCGNGGIQIESSDHDRLAHEISHLLSDADFRALQSQAALARAEHFDWSTTVNKTHAVYDEF